MKIIKLGLLALSMFVGTLGYSQSNDVFYSSPPQVDSLNAKETNDYKFYGKSYDKENFKLKRVNDTLNIYVENQKKISISALNIVKLEDFSSLERDIESFIAITKKLGLDFENDSYQIRFSPSSKELTVKENGEVRYRETEGELYPVLRHEIVFTYYAEMMEISFYLGEIDELLVFQEIEIMDLIQKQGRLHNWFSDYERNIFNKDLKIDSEGELEIITYRNVERSRQVELGIDLGLSVIGNYFPFEQEFIVNYKAKGYNKWVQESNGFFVSLNLYQFLSRPESEKIKVDASIFVNAGLVTGPKNYPLRIYYGRLILNENDNFFQFNKNKIGFDLLVSKQLRVKYELFIGSNDSDWINSIGISFPL